MNKILTLALAAVGLAMLPTPQAKASAPAPVTQSGPTVLPSVVHEAPVVIERRHRRYRYVRRAYFVGGHRRYRSVRVYF